MEQYYRKVKSDNKENNSELKDFLWQNVTLYEE